MNTTTSSFSYEEPYWAPKNKKPKFPYYFEILKDNVLLTETIPLSEHSCYLIGRNVSVLANNSKGIGTIQLDHPSISRYHAIVQHAANGRLYLYDLSSTHGTFWNTKRNHRLKPMRYVPIRLGDMIIFGESSRTYILCVPKEFEERVKQLEQSLQEQSKKLEEEEIKSLLKKKRKHSNKATKNRKEEEEEEMEEDIEEEGDDEEQYEEEFNEEDELRSKRLRIEDQITSESLFDEDDAFFDRTKSSKETKNVSNEAQIETLHSLTEKKQTAYSELYVLKKQYDQLRNEYQNENKRNVGQQNDEEQDELDKFMNNLDRSMKDEVQKKLSSMEKQIEQLEKTYDELNELIKIATPGNVNLQTKDEKKAEIERDRLTRDMFYQDVKVEKKAVPKTQASTGERGDSIPIPANATILQKKKPIIYGAPPESKLQQATIEGKPKRVMTALRKEEAERNDSNS